MTPTKVELDLVIAKIECFKVCGALDPAVASDRSLAERAHEPHRAQLEAAYAAFQGSGQISNPAKGDTALEAHLIVDSGLS